MMKESKFVEQKESSKQIQKMQIMQERQRKIADGEAVGDMAEERIPKKEREVLQVEKPHAVKTKKAQLGPSGSQLQSRYVEQWLNDVIVDAIDLKMPGIVSKPEMALPLCRYEVDRMQLNNQGIDMDTIDRIYRSLFVHSVGFFQMIKDSTHGCPTESKQITQSNLWRVFQICIEYSCKADYKLMTQVIEEKHLEKYEALE